MTTPARYFNLGEGLGTRKVRRVLPAVPQCLSRSNEGDLHKANVIVKAKTLFTFNAFPILHDNAILHVDLQE